MNGLVASICYNGIKPFQQTTLTRVYWHAPMDYAWIHQVSLSGVEMKLHSFCRLIIDCHCLHTVSTWVLNQRHILIHLGFSCDDDKFGMLMVTTLQVIVVK